MWGDVLWVRWVVIFYVVFGDLFFFGEFGCIMKRGFVDMLEMEIDGGGIEMSLCIQYGVVDDYVCFLNCKVFIFFRDIV